MTYKASRIIVIDRFLKVQEGKAGRSSAGFTIIELLVVITIIAVMAGAVSIIVSPGGDKKLLEKEARRLTAIMAFASDEAVFQGVELGVTFYRDGYQFYRWDQPDPLAKEVKDALAEDGEETQVVVTSADDTDSSGNSGISKPEKLPVGNWVAVQEKELKPYTFPEKIEITLEVEGEGVDLSAQPTDEDEDEGKSGFFSDDEAEEIQPIFFVLSSGEVTPFELALSLQDGGSFDDPVYRIEGSLLGSIRLRLPGEEDDDF